MLSHKLIRQTIYHLRCFVILMFFSFASQLQLENESFVATFSKCKNNSSQSTLTTRIHKIPRIINNIARGGLGDFYVFYIYLRSIFIKIQPNVLRHFCELYVKCFHSKSFIAGCGCLIKEEDKWTSRFDNMLLHKHRNKLRI